MTHDAGMSYEYKISFMMFPFLVHCLDLLSSTIGLQFIKTTSINDPNNLEDPLAIMKRGF